ncbi:MAG TPA: PAS domain S-box protein, partial [Oscillatoriaceae cyanobacterium]
MKEIRDIPHVDPSSAIAHLVGGFAEAIALLDAETGRIAYWNQPAEALSGLDAGEIVGRPFVELLAPEAREGFVQRLQRPASPFVVDLLGAAQQRLAIELSLNRLPDGPRSWPLVIMRRFQSEEHLILDAAFQGVLRVDADARVTYANARMADMLGYAHGALDGKSLFELVPPDQIENLNTYVARRQSGIKEQFEFCMARRDGSPLWTLITTNPLHDGAGRYVGAIAMITDLHERRAAEEALRESEELWRSLLEYAPQWVLLIDHDRRIQFISRDVQAETLGRSIYDFTPPEEQAALKACYDTVFDEARPVQYESRVVNPDGSRRWLEAHVGPVILRGEVRYAIAIVSDVDERKTAEERLRKSERQLANAQQMAQIGSWEFYPDTTLTDWSEEIYHIFGFPLDRPGPSLEAFMAVVHPEDRERARRDSAQALSGPGPHVQHFRIVRADGSVRF